MQRLLDEGDFSDPTIIQGHVSSLVTTLNLVMQRMGAEKMIIDPGVELFDPHHHLCVRLISPAESPFPQAPARTVVRIVEDGYTAGGKVITPAKVEVQNGGQPV
jgi:molecular chaperone GrpE (heat shock protein)